MPVTTLERLGADNLRAVVHGYRDALIAHKEGINRLNVYPVPDGDTGTNMALTLDSVCEELGTAAIDMTSTCKAISHGSLMGARGNSGVILSQILRGMAEVLRECEPDGGADAATVAAALDAAQSAAYEAVMRPVEGTILTVVREAAAGAQAAAARGDGLLGVADSARTSAADALARTPELLQVLADAGVVDAGGTGFLLLLDVLLHEIDGRPVPEPDPELAMLDIAAIAHGSGDEHNVGDLRYEVMYFLEAKDETIPAFKDVWAGIGDSIVVVGGDGIWNCHIHTDDIGAAVEAALDAGRPRNIRVTDLLEQMEEERWVREGAEAGGGVDEPPHVNVPVATAVVAVATGDGIRRIFHSLGVQRIVTGGQSMNPSTAQLVEAVESAPASEVVILPNNKNIIPVAEQVQGQTSKVVRVVPTRGITEGFAALVTYDPEASAEDNAAEMTDAAGNVVAGEVTRAVRDAPSEAGPIREGDYLGIARDGIRAVDAGLAAASIALLASLIGDDHEIVTIIEGEGSSHADTRRITEWLREAHPDIAPEVHHGGQPLYPYLFGVEQPLVPRTLGQLAAIPVTELKGVGPERGKALDRLEVTSVLDLLTYYPRRYLDRTRQARIADLRVGEEATVLVEVQRSSARRTRNGKSLVTVDVTDGSGSLRLTFFNQPWRERQLRAGAQVLLFGKVDTYQGRRQMSSPVVDLVGDRTGKIIPVYPQSDKEKIYTWDVGKWVDEALTRAGDFAEPLPPEVLDRFDFVDRHAAFHGVHSPDSMPEMSEARRRLVFDELLRLQLSLVLRKRAIERTSVGIAHDVSGALVRRFLDGLPFSLTGDQQQVITEIEADLARRVPMHRLLQGEVGSGKTIVAVSALLVAVQGGHQGALMAPTEVLAEQHALSVRAMLEGFELGDDGTTLFGARPLQVDVLTNRTTPSERKRLHARLASGETNILIGTHALIQQGIEFRSLGVVVVDEQHKFGVEQRAALRDKGAGEAVPDVLVMTATPIPRTAAMTVYGDLDVSVLKELPPGRERITTSWEKVAPGELTLSELSVWATVREEVAAGRQVYVVCPLIEESEKLEVRSAEETYAELVDGELAGLRLGLIHGRIPAADKGAVMDSFRAGDIDVLVATTVIEVGVDVPNATVMVILDADRFGMAQLHQLRGRVGRGKGLKSHCFLVGAGATDDAEKRLAAMVETSDGFVLAEVDLDIRGEGTIMGERQKGRNDLKLASLRRDREWVQHARDVAIELVDADPTLAAHPLLLDEIESFLGEDERDFLLKG